MDLGELIKQKRGKKTQEDLAKELGWSVHTLGNYEKGYRFPPYQELINLMKVLKISPHELFEGHHPPLWQNIQPVIHLVGPVEKALDPKKIKMGDYYAAPLVDGKIAAGSGLIPSEEVRSLVWIYAPELRSRRTHELVAVQLAKDAVSMRPTLEPGDIVLIDRQDPTAASEFKSGRIYAVRMGRNDDGCAIKRLHSGPGGLIVGSDNAKDYPPVQAWTADLQKLIVGRVVWGWRNLLEA